jgi:hypothetical protein
MTIGSASMRGCNDVNIKRSVREIATTATIKLPVTAVLRQKGKEKTRIETARQIKVGDTVSINLGYGDNLKNEFSGFVRRVNYKTPLEIECEGWAYKLRETNIQKSWPSGTLSDVLTEVVKGTGVKLGTVVNLKLKNFVLNNKSGYSALELLKRDYGLTIFIDNDGKLNACKANDVTGGKVKYRLRWNVLNDGDLKYYNASDLIVEVKAICYDRDGSKIEATVGDKGGEVKTLNFYDVPDMAALKELANQELKRNTYDGYRGKITTMLQPYAEPTMKAILEDNLYTARSGNYYIESTEVTFSTSGARRIVELGIKM